MNLRLYDKKRNCTILEKGYPDWFVPHEGGITEKTTHVDHYIGKGYYKEIFFEGVHIGFGDTVLRNTIELHFESDFETIEMHFALKGNSRASTDIMDQSIGFIPHQHNIIYANGISGKMQWDSEQFQLCEINLAPSFFKKFIPEGNQLFDSFRNAIENGNSRLLSTHHHPINHQMYQIVHEIMNCQRQGVFKRMFLEAKVIELLLLQLEQFADDSVIHTSVKKTDIDKIYAVREFILQNMDAACSLIDLAHKVGTNEFILKKGFKELFGMTVFGFWNDVKMEQAKFLLTEQDMTVGEVSYRTGYQNQRHFSTAFKKKFGVSPSRLKQ